MRSRESAYDKGSMISTENRGLDFYKEKLGFDIEELRGKRILDLGCGEEMALARDLNERKDLGAEVISLTPHLADGYYREKMKELPQSKKSLAAAGQALPFKPESFDVVFALYSLPYYLKDGWKDKASEKEILKKFYQDVILSLKQGGKAYFSPYWETDVELLKEVIGEHKDEFNLKEEKEIDSFLLVCEKAAEQEMAKAV